MDVAVESEYLINPTQYLADDEVSNALVAVFADSPQVLPIVRDFGDPTNNPAYARHALNADSAFSSLSNVATISYDDGSVSHLTTNPTKDLWDQINEDAGQHSGYIDDVIDAINLADLTDKTHITFAFRYGAHFMPVVIDLTNKKVKFYNPKKENRPEDVKYSKIFQEAFFPDLRQCLNTKCRNEFGFERVATESGISQLENQDNCGVCTPFAAKYLIQGDRAIANLVAMAKVVATDKGALEREINKDGTYGRGKVKQQIVQLGKKYASRGDGIVQLLNKISSSDGAEDLSEKVKEAARNINIALDGVGLEKVRAACLCQTSAAYVFDMNNSSISSLKGENNEGYLKYVLFDIVNGTYASEKHSEFLGKAGNKNVVDRCIKLCLQVNEGLNVLNDAVKQRYEGITGSDFLDEEAKHVVDSARGLSIPDFDAAISSPSPSVLSADDAEIGDESADAFVGGDVGSDEDSAVSTVGVGAQVRPLRPFLAQLYADRAFDLVETHQNNVKRFVLKNKLGVIVASVTFDEKVKEVRGFVKYQNDGSKRHGEYFFDEEGFCCKNDSSGDVELTPRQKRLNVKSEKRIIGSLKAILDEKRAAVATDAPLVSVGDATRRSSISGTDSDDVVSDFVGSRFLLPPSMAATERGDLVSTVDFDDSGGVPDFKPDLDIRSEVSSTRALPVRIPSFYHFPSEQALPSTSEFLTSSRSDAFSVSSSFTNEGPDANLGFHHASITDLLKDLASKFRDKSSSEVRRIGGGVKLYKNENMEIAVDSSDHPRSCKVNIDDVTHAYYLIDEKWHIKDGKGRFSEIKKEDFNFLNSAIQKRINPRSNLSVSDETSTSGFLPSSRSEVETPMLESYGGIGYTFPSALSSSRRPSSVDGASMVSSRSSVRTALAGAKDDLKLEEARQTLQDLADNKGGDSFRSGETKYTIKRGDNNQISGVTVVIRGKSKECSLQDLIKPNNTDYYNLGVMHKALPARVRASTGPRPSSSVRSGSASSLGGSSIDGATVASSWRS